MPNVFFLLLLQFIAATRRRKQKASPDLSNFLFFSPCVFPVRCCCSLGRFSRAAKDRSEGKLPPAVSCRTPYAERNHLQVCVCVFVLPPCIECIVININQHTSISKKDPKNRTVKKKQLVCGVRAFVCTRTCVCVCKHPTRFSGEREVCVSRIWAFITCLPPRQTAAAAAIKQPPAGELAWKTRDTGRWRSSRSPRCTV